MMKASITPPPMIEDAGIVAKAIASASS